jgi:PTS system lactose-specific IIA component
MNKEEVTMIGFEIVAYAGEARSNLIEAINVAKEGEYEKAEELVKEADETIKEAHNIQTKMLSKEAAGEEMEIGFIMVHGQDHLMTTLLLRDIVEHLVNLYKKG